MGQGNILREVYDNSYRILDSLWWVFVNYFSFYWNCLKLCYFASKLSTSEDALAISDLPAFLSQMFHSKIFSQLDGKSVKLKKAVVGIISPNYTLIFWFHMGEWHKNLKYESPPCSWSTLINSSFSISNINWQTRSVKTWNIFKSYYSSSCFQSYISTTAVWWMNVQWMFAMIFMNVKKLLFLRQGTYGTDYHQAQNNGKDV